MLKKIKEEIIIKTTILEIIINSIIISIVLTIASYLCLTSFNQGIVKFLNLAAKYNSEYNFAIKVTLIIFPMLLVVTFCYKLGKIVTFTNLKKK